jgi:DNA repair photolyase
MPENKSGFSRGRGAVSNTANRFEQVRLEPIEFDEMGEGSGEDPVEGLPTGAPRRVKTRFFRDHSRSIISKNDSPDVGIGVSINAYRGCEHGCIYCYARPTHEYLGFSAGIEFESKIMVKEDAPELLRREMLSPKWEPQVITMSGVTDCYQPAEKHFRLTRRLMEAMQEFRNPFCTISKNHLVTRDIDILADMASRGQAACFVSVTSLRPELTAVLEPRTSRPAMRLKAIEELSNAGVPVGVMVAPIIPGLTDHEMPEILAAAKKAGAKFAGYTIVRLPLAVKPLFIEWLETHFPDRKDKVLNILRSMREGKLNDSNFGTRMRGLGPYADQINALFKLQTRKLGMNQEEMEFSTAEFRRPGEQMRLF